MHIFDIRAYHALSIVLTPYESILPLLLRKIFSDLRDQHVLCQNHTKNSETLTTVGPMCVQATLEYSPQNINVEPRK
jgi:hypothetical protein